LQAGPGKINPPQFELASQLRLSIKTGKNGVSGKNGVREHFFLIFVYG
jgi:hypothetical protein